MKKILSLSVSLLLALVLLAGCVEDGAPADGAPTTVTIWFMGGTVVEDADVVAAANARLQELGLNIAINPVWVGGWSMWEPAQIALDTGDTEIDIFWTGSWGLNFWQNTRAGNFIRLDDPENDLLARYGQDMLAAVPQALWDAFTMEGSLGLGIYGVPGYKDYAQLYAWDVNVTLLEELGFDFYELFDPDGVNYHVIFDPMFEEAMQAAKDELGPTFFPLAIEGGNFPRMFSNTDHDLTDLGIFHFPFDPENPALPTDTTAGILHENELFLAVLDRLHHFWNMGFIDPRAAIPGEGVSAFVDQRNNAEYLFSNIVYAYGHTTQASYLKGIDNRFPRVSNPLVSSISAAGSGFAVSVYSRNQAAAVQFLNAWYTDTILADILAEGVEGTHITRNDDGTITRLPGGRDAFATWRFGMGNLFNLTPLDTEGADYLERFRAYNEAGIPTSLIGFTFDNTPVLTEMAALSSVVDEFQLSLATGAADPAVVVPQYLAALRANGLDRVHEELNRQIEAFHALRDN